VRITVYDDKGETVRALADSFSAEVVHNATLSANPLYADGIKTSVITNSAGEIIGVWDGKNSAGKTVFSGTYYIKITTIDKDGNEYSVIISIDVIASSSAAVDLTAHYPDGKRIVLAGRAVNASDMELKIYNIAGELVFNARIEPSAGRYIYTWNCVTAGGIKTARGVYIAALEYVDSGTGQKAAAMRRIAVK